MKTLRFLIVLSLFVNCTTDSSVNEKTNETQTEQLNTQNCTNDLPRARLTNNGTVSHDLEIYDSNSNLLVSAYNISPGVTTGWFEFNPQEVLFSIENDSFRDEKVLAIMSNCTQFDMIIGTDDLLISYEITTNDGN